jgi:hypothetical protein
MSRRFTALKPQLNRIRAWAHEGSTDAWIAHQLETTADAVRAFRQEHGIERGGPAPLAPITPDSVVEAMLAEEAVAAAAGEPAAAESELGAEPEPAPAAARAPRTRQRAKVAAQAPQEESQPPAEESLAEAESPADVVPARGSSRRGSRGGAGRKSSTAAPAEPAEAQPPAVPEEVHAAGEDEAARSSSTRKRGRRRGRGRGAGRGLEARLLAGSVLLLDPSVAADAAFQEHWQEAGPLRVEIGVDAIILRRAPADGEPDHSQV